MGETMKRFSKMLVLPLIVAGFLAAAPAARAGSYTLGIVLDSPFQSTADGTLTFSGTITNLTNGNIPLIGDSFTLTGAGISADDTDFYVNTPLSLDGGANSGDLDLFTITVAPGTAPGLYAEVFDILDANGNVIGQVDFDIDVTPEPGTILLLGTGLLLLAGLIRWRVPKTETMTAA